MLAIARAEGYACHALSVDYGQRHGAELDAAARVARALARSSTASSTIDLAAFGGSALTDASIAVPTGGAEPARSRSPTCRRATRSSSRSRSPGPRCSARTHIFFGANAVDYSGYPDCRPEFMHAFERLANLATKRGGRGHGRSRSTRRSSRSRKAEIVRRGAALGVDYALTVSCYQADADGRACGACDACRLRRAGFEAAGVADPTRYRSPD